MYVPQVEEKAKAYVTMGVDIPGLYDKNVLVKRVQVTLYAICHQDLMKTEFGAARTDCMAARLSAAGRGWEICGWFRTRSGGLTPCIPTGF